MEKLNADAPPVASSNRVWSFGLQRITRLCVVLVERVMPDPFVIAILLTLLTCALALAIAPKASVPEVLTSWYDGVFKIASFAFLVALTLVFLFATATLLPYSLYSVAVAKLGTPITITALIALLVCLIPTTIGALL